MTSDVVRRVGGGTVMSVVAASLVVAAVSSEGYRTTSTDLHDGSVWTMSVDRQSVMRVNARIDEFDTRVRADVSSAELFQDGTSVYVQTPEGFAAMNAVGSSLGGVTPVEVPAGTQIDVGGGSAAMLLPGGGLFVVPAQALESIDVDAEPMAQFPGGSQLVVSPDGFVIVVDAVDDTFTVIENRVGEVDAGGEQFVVRDPVAFGFNVPEAGESAADFQVSAVGDLPVVIDEGELLAPDVVLGDVAESAVLQLPGVAADAVVVASSEGLVAWPLDGGAPSVLIDGASGRSARPAVVGECVYGAWEAERLVFVGCSGAEPARFERDGDQPVGVNWRFRVNRNEVVLEAAGADPVHISDDGLVAIDNWQDFESDQEQEDQDDSEEEPDQLQRATCSDEPGPPDARDDRFGASPGVATVLRVLDNDRDPNCDPIAIQPLGPEDWNDEWGSIALIEQGQAFQFTPGIDPVSFSFSYTIDDGRGGEASASVSVDVGAGENRPPRVKDGRVSETIVEMFETVTYNVLVDWEDPDGDALLLSSALLGDTSAGGSSLGEGSMIWSQDGTITYTATDTVAGPKEITVLVDDGFGNVVEGTLNVSVQGEGVPLQPTARDDYVTTPVGREVVVSPLQNDTDPNGDVLVLGPYERPEAVRVAQGEGNTLKLTADEAGTYLLKYTATDGTLTDEATIRLEVEAPSDVQRPPIAVRDSVVLKAGRALNVDVLANDYDPDGDVIVVTGARLQTIGLTGVDVKVIDRRLVRVEASTDPGSPIIIDYTITDGVSVEQQGQLVVNVAPAVGNQRPVPVEDSVRVRVNDVVDIAVLENDSDPDGDEITILSAELDPPTQPGVLWLDGRTVRYRAGSEGGTVKAVYTVDDTPERSGLNAASAFIEIVVIDAAEEDNLPPTPSDIETRVFAGSTVKIPIPTTGTDPDGDSVRIVEIQPGPPPLSLPAQLGTARIVNDHIEYTANVGASGQDVFGYEVEDTFGLRSLAYVRVGVSNTPNQPPSLVPDEIRARPGRLLQIPVLSNDTDPDGDALSLESVDPPADLDAFVNDNRVEVQLPFEAGTWQMFYEATDGKGPPATQILTVISDPEAPLLAPVLRDDPDDTVGELELVEGATGWSTTLDVISNDDDPDGARSELDLFLPIDQGVQAVLDPVAGTMRVELTDRPQQIVYGAEDLDDNESYAVVRVPRAPEPIDEEDEEAANQPPVLRQDAIVATIVALESGEIRVDDYVVDPDGDPVELAGQNPTSNQGTVTLRTGDFEAFDFVPDLVAGQAIVTIAVPVTDRPGDPEATVTLPFEVIVEKPNEPPIANAYTGDVEQLADANPVNLVSSGVVTDPEGDALTFSLVDGGIDGLDVNLDVDGTITAAVTSAPKGVSATYRYTVTDNEPDRVPVEGSFTINVVASTKPLVSPIPRVVEELNQGVQETTAVLDGVLNPFPGEPLTVINAELSDGEGAVSFTDSTVSFTPPDDYFGTAEVRYTIQDGTLDEARNVVGTIRYTIIGRPLAPGQPRVVEVFSETAVVEWEPADPQGAPITDYVVRWSQGQFATGGATTATIEGLTNNQPYTFTVSAINKVGESDESISSGEVIPDEVPPAPGPPRIVDFGDGTLTVEWDEVIPNGSPVILYHLTLSGDSEIPLPGSTLSYTWDGLTNGTEYTFSLVAENNEGRGDASGLSNPLSPARQPDIPTTPTVTDVGTNLRALVRVEWSEPYNQGRDIDYFEIEAVATGQTYRTTTTSIEIELPPGQDSRFRVRAHNVVGFSGWSGQSANFEAIVAPARPGAPPTVEELDRALQVTSATTTSDGGDPIVRYEFNGSSGQFATSTSRTATIGGLTNGVAYSMNTRVCNKKFCSEFSQSRSGLIPFGPPNEAAVSLGGALGAWSGQSRPITWSWSTNGAYNGRPLTYTISGAGVSSTQASGSVTRSYNQNTSNTVQIRVSDGDSRTPDVVKTATVSTGSAPNPRVSIGLGSRSTSSTGCVYGDALATGDTQGCYNVRITLADFSGTRTVRCYSSTNAGVWRLYASFSAGNGTYNRCSYSSAGRWVVVIVDGTTSSSSPQAPSTSGVASNVYGQWPTN